MWILNSVVCGTFADHGPGPGLHCLRWVNFLNIDWTLLYWMSCLDWVRWCDLHNRMCCLVFYSFKPCIMAKHVGFLTWWILVASKKFWYYCGGWVLYSALESIFWSFSVQFWYTGSILCLPQLIVFFASVIKAPKNAVLAGVQVGAGAGARVCLGLYLKLLIFFWMILPLRSLA